MKNKLYKSLTGAFIASTIFTISALGDGVDPKEVKPAGDYELLCSDSLTPFQQRLIIAKEAIRLQSFGWPPVDNQIKKIYHITEGEITEGERCNYLLSHAFIENFMKGDIKIFLFGGAVAFELKDNKMQLVTIKKLDDMFVEEQNEKRVAFLNDRLRKANEHLAKKDSPQFNLNEYENSIVYALEALQKGRESRVHSWLPTCDAAIRQLPKVFFPETYQTVKASIYKSPSYVHDVVILLKDKIGYEYAFKLRNNDVICLATGNTNNPVCMDIYDNIVSGESIFKDKDSRIGLEL